MTGNEGLKKLRTLLLTAAGFAPVAGSQAGPPIAIEDPPAEFFVRGDSNHDNAVNISDPVRVLNYLFTGAESIDCLEAADSNDDGAVNIADAVSLLNYLFVGGPDPQSPFNECGIDLTADGIVCQAYPACADPVPREAFKLRDNGQRCPEGQEPCFGITATGVNSPATVLLSAVDVSHMYHPPPDPQAFLTALLDANSHRVGVGFLQTGPPGPLGLGLTFVVLAAPIDNRPDPDLALTGLRVLEPEFPRGGGVDVPVQVRVMNIGRISTLVDFGVAIRRGATTLDTFRMGPLEPQATATVTRTLHFPESAKNDRVTITAVADPADEIKEIPEDNNSRSATFTIPGDCHIEIINGKPVRICE